MNKTNLKKLGRFLLKLLASALILLVCAYADIFLLLILPSVGIHMVLVAISVVVLPSLLLPLIWLKNKKRFLKVWSVFAVCFFIGLGVDYGMEQYDKSITINTSPNIRIREYMPFDEESKIVKHKSETVRFTENLPRIDGAAALFPVYSAFVNATYPESVTLNDGSFEYNNTPEGYRLLAEKETDMFIGVYPSEKQIAYAKENNTEFIYTPIGTEAFVFFVHKDNPIDSLTEDEIRKIYSGEIKNWKDVGGKNEEIAAFQRNEGSGSQSMLKRFMGDTALADPPKELVNDLMSGIIEKVSDYRSKTNSIGFSFRYYVEGIIKNPDIKMLKINDVAPTAENIKNGSYPIVTPIYAVTYENNENENVGKMLEWILSGEGQAIIDETGYVGIK